MPITFVRLLRVASAIMLIGAGCAGGSPHDHASAKITSSTAAAQLRAKLNTLLAEHVVLAASATGAAVGGRGAEFKAAAAALDANSVDLARAIGSVYGPDAETGFLGLWRRHIGFFVDYTTGMATKDLAQRQKARDNLARYGEQFGALIHSVNPSLSVATLADLVTIHIGSLIDVIDAQGAGDPVEVYTALRKSVDHMHMIADPLAEAIVTQFPGKFGSERTTAQR